MTRWTVTRSYAAVRDGTRLGPWTAGDSVELDDELAAWIGRDSPGALAPIKAKAAPAPATGDSAKGKGKRR
ncbi:hypothetical protein [Nocardiopsis dassonvillei]|uniref:hypothetical protein n=1 Tax=Nocardiopsis dassonvillei TaxID=2014 RepID=UPI003644461F